MFSRAGLVKLKLAGWSISAKIINSAKLPYILFSEDPYPGWRTTALFSLFSLQGCVDPALHPSDLMSIGWSKHRHHLVMG